MNKYQEMYKHIADNQYQYGTDEDWELFKELVDKATPMKLYYEGDSCDEDGQIIYDTAICQNCGRHFETYYDEHVNYCPSCGQRLVWAEEEEEDD